MVFQVDKFKLTQINPWTFAYNSRNTLTILGWDAMMKMKVKNIMPTFAIREIMNKNAKVIKRSKWQCIVSWRGNYPLLTLVGSQFAIRVNKARRQLTRLKAGINDENLYEMWRNWIGKNIFIEFSHLRKKERLYHIYSLWKVRLFQFDVTRVTDIWLASSLQYKVLC